MSQMQVIRHEGRSIVLVDFTGLQTPTQWTEAVAEARRFFRTLPADGSALPLADVSGTRYNREPRIGDGLADHAIVVSARADFQRAEERIS